jgi:hypothetical protein
VPIVNLTRSTVVVFSPDGEEVLLELPTSVPSADAEFVAQQDRIIEEGEGDSSVRVSVVRHRFRIDAPLPLPRPGTTYVVGFAVLQALHDHGQRREDLVAPDTARDSAVRDSRGRILGVRRFRVL